MQTLHILEKVVSGTLTNIASGSIERCKGTILSRHGSEMTISEYQRSYNNINRFLYSLDKKKFSRNRTPVANKSVYDLEINTGYTIILKNRNKINVYVYEKEGKMYGEKLLQLRFSGPNKFNIRNRVLKEALKIGTGENIPLEYAGEQNLHIELRPHSFDNVILDDSYKIKIVDGLKNWANSKEWYHKHQLVHKIGILLHGEAGTGKSTIVRAISTMFNNVPIITVDPNNIMQSIQSIIRMRNKVDGVIIVLLEDFDMYTRDRANGCRNSIQDASGNTVNPSDGLQAISGELNTVDNNVDSINIRMNTLFQLLDGIYSTEDTIYVGTTNYVEKVDSALIRPGRFDISVELKYFNREQAIEMLSIFGESPETLDSFGLEEPYQPALLQSKIIEQHRENIK